MICIIISSQKIGLFTNYFTLTSIGFDGLTKNMNRTNDKNLFNRIDAFSFTCKYQRNKI